MGKTMLNWRGGQVTRLEALTDTVFGFAITLLVVSLEVPDRFSELTALLEGFIAFAASFAILIMVWVYLRASTRPRPAWRASSRPECAAHAASCPVAAS